MARKSSTRSYAPGSRPAARAGVWTRTTEHIILDVPRIPSGVAGQPDLCILGSENGDPAERDGDPPSGHSESHLPSTFDPLGRGRRIARVQHECRVPFRQPSPLAPPRAPLVAIDGPWS